MFKLKPPVKHAQCYDDDMRPMSDILSMMMSIHRPAFASLVLKYKETFTNESGQREFEEFIKAIILDARKMMSDKYVKNILTNYFTEYGQIAIMHDALKTMFMLEYTTMSKGF